MGKENPCSTCVKNCCRDYKIALQKRDPQGYMKLLEKFPFIKITGQELALFNGREAMMNIHNCDRLHKDGSCRDYDAVERPQFCLDAGIKAAPHEQCLIFDHQKMIEKFLGFYQREVPHIESVAGWKELPIIECGEKLVRINDFASDFIVVKAKYWENGLQHARKDQFLREGVLSRLINAAKLLPRGMKIVVWDAWRPLEVQQALFNQHLETLKTISSCLSEQELIILAQTYVSLPSSDPTKPSPHFTGGAVDLILLDGSGNEINMGTGFDHFGPESGLRYFEDGENQEVKRNRRLLYWVMKEAGFSGYDEEWWHFDFGNQFDAKRTGKSHASYGRVDL